MTFFFDLFHIGPTTRRFFFNLFRIGPSFRIGRRYRSMTRQQREDMAAQARAEALAEVAKEASTENMTRLAA